MANIGEPFDNYGIPRINDEDSADMVFRGAWVPKEKATASNFDNPADAIKARNQEMRESMADGSWYAGEPTFTFGPVASTVERIEGRTEKVANLAMAIEALEGAVSETRSGGTFTRRWAELIERMTVELEAIMGEKE